MTVAYVTENVVSQETKTLASKKKIDVMPDTTTLNPYNNA